MHRWPPIAMWGAVVSLAAMLPAEAGIPRGVILTADEQEADTATGVTIARGNAEISVDKRPILGHADVIELNPGKNQIQFKGRAVLTVGHARYDSSAVTCSLDFDKCAAVIDDQVAAPSSAVPRDTVTGPR